MEIITGYPNGSFKPAQAVNKVEFLKMLLKANHVDLFDLNMHQLPYNDAIPGQWYAKYLMYAKMFTLLEPDKNDKVEPGKPLTRGMAADIIYRFRNLQSKNKLHPVLNATNQNTIDNSTNNNTNSSSNNTTDKSVNNSVSSSTAPANLLNNYALFVSKSGLFAVQYPKNWFYQITDNHAEDPNNSYYSNILKTYYFGPKDLTTNPPQVTLELLPRTGKLKGNHIYHGVPYYQTTSPDKKEVIIINPQSSKKLYRFSGNSSDEQIMLNMISTVTEQIKGMSSYNSAEISNLTNTNTATNTATTTNTATSNSSTSNPAG